MEYRSDIPGTLLAVNYSQKSAGAGRKALHRDSPWFTKKGADPGSYHTHQARETTGFLGRVRPSPEACVAHHAVRRNAADKNSPSELPVPQKANRNQKCPGCVTHSARGLRIPGNPRVRSTCLGLSSAPATRVKAQGAPSREKWGQGGESGGSQGAKHRKGTEYARREAFPWLGTEERGSPDTTSGRKGFAMAEWSQPGRAA